MKAERYTLKQAKTEEMATCRGCAGQFKDAECRHPHINKRACWHEVKRTANDEFKEALSRVHSHLVVLAEGQDAILRALGKRGRYGQG